MNAGSLCQIEIPVRDLKAALAFYRAVFGWKPVPAEMHSYVVIDVPVDCTYGISLVPTPAERIIGQSFTLYFESENPQETLDRVEPAGGKRRLGPKSLPGYGNIWHFVDLDGNQFGLFKKL